MPILFSAMTFRTRLLTLSLALAGLAPLAASAGDYYVVTPLHGRAMEAPPVEPDPIVVELLAGGLDRAKAYSPYSFDLWDKLRVSNDPNFDPNEVAFAASNQLPVGMNLRSDGVLEGTPATPMQPSPMLTSYSFRVTASYRGETADASYMLMVDPSGVEMTLNDGTLPKATVGKPYEFDLRSLLAIGNEDTPEDERPPKKWEGTMLPPGLSLSPEGTLMGTPTERHSWGYNYQAMVSYKDTYAQRTYILTVGGAPLEVVKIATGSSHTCAITMQGALYCWGENSGGQLGTNTPNYMNEVPEVVQGLTSGVTHVSLGYGHTCAVHNGAAKCWGMNTEGVVGLPSGVQQSPTPVQVPNLTSGVTGITAGMYHSCAIHNGGAKCWGGGSAGKLGNGSTTNSHIPVQVTGLTNGVVSVSAGTMHTCAAHHGAAKCWGSNNYGQLGAAAGVPANAPTAVSTLASNVSRVTAGSTHSCAAHNGQVKCWGANNSQQLGITSGNTHVPTVVPGISGAITDLTSFVDSTCVVAGGNATCWGDNLGGKLGSGTRYPTQAPTRVGATGAVSSIGIGFSHGCAVVDQEAKCYGSGYSGQLGQGIPAAGQLVPDPSVEQ